MKHLLVIFFLVSLPTIAQTNLGLGDIAFTGYQSESGDRFAFVLLKDIESGTKIVFTDKGWKASGGFYEPVDEPENTINWISTSSLTYGTQILIQTIELSDGTKVLASSHGNASGDTFGLSDSGDQIFAYQGSRPTSGDQSNFLAAIQMNGEWNEDATSDKKSSKPSIFTDGVNSLYIIDSDGTEVDNAVYDCSVISSNANTLRGAVNNASNWIRSDSFKNDPILIPYCSEPLPVELVTFEAAIIEGRVDLIWETATETNNYGFEIEKMRAEENSQNFEWNKLGFIAGNGNSNSPRNYSYTDAAFETTGKYFYRLKQIDIDGSFEYSDVVEVIIESPQFYDLSQNYPNPFNPNTVINYSIPKDGFVTLSIYDVLGKEIIKIVNEEQSAGNYSAFFNASELTSGLYFYTIKSGNYIETKKMLLIK